MVLTAKQKANLPKALQQAIMKKKGGMKKEKTKPMTKESVKPMKKELTKDQKDKLKEAAKHHSSKHMSMMRKLMKEGMSFMAAHKKALKEVGK